MTAQKPSTLTLGKLLRRWRCSRKLSQRDFGQLLVPKAPQSTVSCWENGFRRPSWRYLQQIIAVTGLPARFALDAYNAGPEGEQP